MNSRNQRTYDAIFQEPTLSSIEWADIEALFRHLGAEITEGRGSRVRVSLNGSRQVFHRPHPQKETNKGAVEAVRDFLLRATP